MICDYRIMCVGGLAFITEVDSDAALETEVGWSDKSCVRGDTDGISVYFAVLVLTDWHDGDGVRISDNGEVTMANRWPTTPRGVTPGE